MNLFTKQKQTHRLQKQTMVTEGEKGWRRTKLGLAEANYFVEGMQGPTA